MGDLRVVRRLAPEQSPPILRRGLEPDPGPAPGERASHPLRLADPPARGTTGRGAGEATDQKVVGSARAGRLAPGEQEIVAARGDRGRADRERCRSKAVQVEGWPREGEPFAQPLHQDGRRSVRLEPAPLPGDDAAVGRRRGDGERSPGAPGHGRFARAEGLRKQRRARMPSRPRPSWPETTRARMAPPGRRRFSGGVRLPPFGSSYAVQPVTANCETDRAVSKHPAGTGFEYSPPVVRLAGKIIVGSPPEPVFAAADPDPHGRRRISGRRGSVSPWGATTLPCRVDRGKRGTRIDRAQPDGPTPAETPTSSALWTTKTLPAPHESAT